MSTEPPVKLLNPNRSETFPPLPEALPGPAGVPDPARMEAAAQLLGVGSESVQGLMGSTYTAQVGGALYRDLQESILVEGTIPTQLDALDVGSDATTAWTRSDLIAERVLQVLQARGVRLPSDAAMRRLAQSLTVLLLQGARVETLRVAVEEAIGAADDLTEYPEVVAREVGRDQKILGSRSVPSPSPRVEIEIPFPPRTDLETEWDATESVLSATRPAAVVADPRYVATEQARTAQESLEETQADQVGYEDARWYFSGIQSAWQPGRALGGTLLVTELDQQSCPLPTTVWVEVSQWGREAKREVVRIGTPLELYREGVPIRYRIGAQSGIGYRRGVTFWADQPLFGRGQIELDSTLWQIGWVCSDPRAVRLLPCLLGLDRPIPEGQLRYRLEDSPRGRAVPKLIRFVTRAP